ncbi:MAG: SDR family NAD(P)-dependent oxidoreductase [Chakrabartia sp.]
MGIAVITGAGSGIGAGLARLAVRRGMTVVLADRDEAGLQAVAAELGAAAHCVPTDVADPAALEKLADTAFALGEVDLLFNNAGVLSTGLSWEIPVEVWQASLNVNIAGIVNGLRAFVPRLNAAGRPARIINTASVGGFLPSPFMAPYSATKFAVVALTEALAGELAALGSPVAVSLLAPGPVKTGIFREPPMDASRPFHDAMTAMLDQYGLSADALAEIVFAGIDRGDYWIIPQPETLDADLQKRTAGILAREAPSFYSTGE